MNNEEKAVYLDAAAAAPVSRRIAHFFAETAAEFFANPESAHSAGRRSRELIDSAAERINRTLNTAGETELNVFFTSSATEAINAALAFPGMGSGTVVLSPSLHPAPGEAARRLKPCEIRVPALDSQGGIDLDDLAAKMDDSVSAVVVEHVQNETGRIQNIEEIGAIVKKNAPNAVFAVDTVQSVGKIPISWKSAGINIAFVGGHKIGAPCGGAILWNFPKTNQTISAKFADHLRNSRSGSHALGRPDPAVCATLAEALAETAEHPLEQTAELSSLFRLELAKLADELRLDLIFPVPEECASPYITMFLIPPYQGEILARMLSDVGVMLSYGSACEAAGGKASGALSAMGISDKTARTMLRTSFSRHTAQEDPRIFIQALRNAIKDY